jgi:hypothetical protein
VRVESSLLPPPPLRDGWFADSPLEEAVTSELVSESHSLLAGSLQGISSKRLGSASTAAKKGPKTRALRADSLRIRTGNFWWPCREFKAANREISTLIREIRSGLSLLTGRNGALTFFSY